MKTLPASLLLLSLAACQVTTTGPAVKASTKPAGATATAGSTSSASTNSTASPTSTPKASPSPADVQAALLKPPSGAYQTLTGTVLADPAWLKAKAAGSLLSNNGGSLAAPNGGAIISDNGAGVLVDGGGALVAAASGNVIPDEASGLAPRRGGAAVRAGDGSLAAAGGLIANNGGGVISDNGGSLIGNNAAGLVANNAAGLTGKVKYGLAQAADVPPTAGMLVSAVSLKTHEYLPVGVDAKGQAVYAVYSNLKGEYQLFLPKAEEGNVLVVASAPNSADPHLVYNAVTPVQAPEPVPVDPDVAQATKLLRQLFVAHMANLLTGQPDDGYFNALGTGDKGLATQLGATLKAFSDLVAARAKAAGVPTGPGAAAIPEVHELAEQMSDAGIGFVDTSQLVTNAIYEPTWKGPQEPAMKALGQSFGLIRAGAKRWMDLHPAPRPLLVDFLIDGRTEPGSKVPACDYRVTASLQEPGDYGAFIVERILGGRETHSIINTRYALEAIADPPVDREAPLRYAEGDPNWYLDAASGEHYEVAARINVCMGTIAGVLTLTLTPPGWTPGDTPPAAVAQVLSQIDRFAASHTFSAAPPASARPPCAP
jgi:hypothetical protein